MKNVGPARGRRSALQGAKFRKNPAKNSRTHLLSNLPCNGTLPTSLFRPSSRPLFRDRAYAHVSRAWPPPGPPDTYTRVRATKGSSYNISGPFRPPRRPRQLAHVALGRPQLRPGGFFVRRSRGASSASISRKPRQRPTRRLSQTVFSASFLGGTLRFRALQRVQRCGKPSNPGPTETEAFLGEVFRAL